MTAIPPSHIGDTEISELLSSPFRIVYNHDKDIEKEKQRNIHGVANILLKENKVNILVTENGEQILLDNDQRYFSKSVEQLCFPDGTMQELEFGDKIVLKYGERFIEKNNGEVLELDNSVDIIHIPITYLIDDSDVEKAPPEDHSDYFVITLEQDRYYVPYSAINKENTYNNAKVIHKTLMDLTSMQLDEDSGENIQWVIQEVFGDFDYSKGSESYNELNYLYKEAVKLYKNRSGGKDAEPQFTKIENKEFKSKKSIHTFIKNTLSKDRYKSTVHCTLCKYIYLLHRYEQNPIYGLLKNIEDGVIQKKEILNQLFGKDFQYESEDKLFTTGFIEYKGIKHKIKFRVKSLESIHKKSFNSNQYIDLSNFKDIFGITLYSESPSQVVEVLEYLDSVIYHGQSQIKNKGLISIQDIDHLEEQDNDFVQRLKIGIKKGTVKKAGSSDNYLDTKSVGNSRIRISNGVIIELGTEIKHVILNGTNQDDNDVGLEFQGIYNYFSKLKESEFRKKPYISENDFNGICQRFFSSHELLNSLHDNDKSKYDFYREIYTDLYQKGLINNTQLDEQINEMILDLQKNNSNLERLDIQERTHELIFGLTEKIFQPYFSNDRKLKGDLEKKILAPALKEYFKTKFNFIEAESLNKVIYTTRDAVITTLLGINDYSIRSTK